MSASAMTVMEGGSRPGRALAIILCRALGSLGSAVATFGLEVSLFQRTGSYSAFVLLVILTSVPTLLLSPAAGIVADRLHKGAILAACEVASIGVVLSALVMNASSALSGWQIGAVVVSLAIVETFRWPSLSAALPSLAAPRELVKLNGLSEALRSANVIFGPLVGLLTLQRVGLSGMLTVDILALAAGLVGMFQCQIISDKNLDPVENKEGAGGVKPWSGANVFLGLTWIFRHSAFRRLAVLFAVANCGFAVLAATITPYVLSFAAPPVLATTMLADGVGVLVGGALLGTAARLWPLHRIVLCGVLAEAIVMTIWGIARNPILVVLCAFGIAFCAGAVNGASQTLWQSLVPQSIQGRVFAARLFIASALTPIALLLSLPMGQHVLVPFLSWNRTNGWDWIESNWGGDRAGPLGLMLCLLGTIVIVNTFGVASRGGLNHLVPGNAGDPSRASSPQPDPPKT